MWCLNQLRDMLGKGPFEALWTRLMVSLGLALGATRGALREAHAWLRPSIRDYGFQMIGADYLLDQGMRVSA